MTGIGTMLVKRKSAFGLALIFAAAMLTPGAATPDPRERSGQTPDLRADYTVYVGGLIVAEGSMSATLNGADYRLQNKLGSAGLPRKFWDAKWVMTSEGRIEDGRLHPGRFAFTSTEDNETKHRLLVYDASGTPALTFDPPLSPEDEARTSPYERINTLDPVSALLLPVVADGNPCNRKLPVFDGKRRYDLQLVFDRVATVTTRDKGYSGEAIRCKVRFIPHTGMERAKLTTMLQRRDDTWIWLVPVEDTNLYFPVRVQMRTPIGGAVMDVVKLSRNETKDTASLAAKPAADPNGRRP